MTMPGRLLDYFALEASEYLTRLETLVGRPGMQSSDATQFVAAARGLRGSATMAKASGPARLATAVERIASNVAQGALAWEPEVQRALVGAVEDLKLLVRGVRNWGAEQDARLEASVNRLAPYAPEREERKDVVLPISQLFYADDGPHIVYVAPNPRTHYEQQLREQGGGIGPGVLSPEVKGAPSAAEALAQQTTPQPTPARATPLNTQTPPKGRELRDVLNSSLATMRSLETRHSGPQPASQDLVPIQELLYRGQRAIERAAEIRRALKKSGTPPTRALVDELVDLVELAATE
jgi:chemotaxis protein histidine kinase CheA